MTVYSSASTYYSAICTITLDKEDDQEAIAYHYNTLSNVDKAKRIQRYTALKSDLQVLTEQVTAPTTKCKAFKAIYDVDLLIN